MGSGSRESGFPIGGSVGSDLFPSGKYGIWAVGSVGSEFPGFWKLLGPVNQESGLWVRVQEKVDFPSAETEISRNYKKFQKPSIF